MSFIDKFNYNRNKITDTVSDTSISSNLKNFVDHAYGFRKIHPDYAGYCCRLRKISADAAQNNTFLDFKFDKNQKLSLDSSGYTTDTQALVGTLSSWVGSETGELEILYDQGLIGQADSSEAINLVHYTGYQSHDGGARTERNANHTNPLIVDGGVLQTSNGAPVAKLTGSGIMHFDGGIESNGVASGLHSDNGGTSEVFVIGKLPPASTANGVFDENDTVGSNAAGTQYRGNFLIGGHINSFVEDMAIGSIGQSADDTRMYFYYENGAGNGNAITGQALNSTDTLLLSAFTNPNTAGFKVNNFRQTKQFNGGVEAEPVGVDASKTPKIILLGAPAFADASNNRGKGEFQELIFSTQTLTDAQRIGVENYMASYFNSFSLDSSSLTSQEKSSLGFNIFKPTYGAQMSFQAENSSWKGSSFYQFISPRGLNNLRLKSKLSFVNNLAQTKTLLNYIESITTGDITGEQAFTGDISYLNFGSIKNGIEISFDTDYYRNFSGSQIIDYTVVDLSDDVYKVDVSLFNNTVSPVLSNGMAFVSDKTSAISDGNFSKFDVATGSTTDCNPTVFDNYFYLTADRVNSISASNVSGVSTYTGVADDSTRTFFWEPDRSIPLAVNHANRTEFFKNSFVKTLNISENQNSLNQIELTFTNRSQKETYSMLHFLESHLGYKHFVYYHDNDVINKNKVFYCPRWDHTLVYKDSNNIKATFVEIVAPTIPV